MRRYIAALGLLWCSGLAAAGRPGAGASAQVVDPDGKPVEGAKACVVAENVEQLCESTNSEGFYLLPESEATTVRILAVGFLPRRIPAVRQKSPVVLERAASLRVRLVDKAGGKGPSRGEVFLQYTTGRRLGPFPTNAAGASLKTLPPGDIHAVGRAEGYRETTGPLLTLVAGQEREIVVELVREARTGKR